MANPMRITVVRGRPDAAELAAVTAVLLALARRSGEPDEETRAAYAGWTVKRGGHRPAVTWTAP
ncbi:acyl-CoA carboxylase subunit epsilon [Streptomyces sp. NBC_01341]|uniref:acyl-CoA carboxylase subunit epsilon n=1 Tax=Streptomyces sp. NBC_01341 TaxID=2903831 RepID=UPI002E141698|nr:acyl-CoA carboxylase subunit epsilon [Streptomyces sp. NBC_01341]